MSSKGLPKLRLRLAAHKAAARSRVTNGRCLLAGVDGRSTWVRRARDLINEHLGDLGGADNTSAAERSLVRRASVMTVELEMLERKFALAGQADAIDLDLYQRTAGNLRRILETLGLERRQKNITPSLAEYLANRDQSREAEVTQ
jgi:hypothetical protein